MSDKINVEEILSKHGIIKGFTLHSNPKLIDETLKTAIKEIVELAIDKCGEHCIACTGLSDDSSLQEIKQMIDYE